MLPPAVFISYRRCDTSAVAQLLSEQLKGAWPDPEQRDYAVFLDEASIDPGREFTFDVRFALEHCRLVVVLIGREWQNELQARQLRKGQIDWVLEEISLAFRWHKVVIPVLVRTGVDDIKMPDAASLPSSISRFAHLQALTIECRSDSRVGPEFDGTACKRLLELYAQHEPPRFDEIVKCQGPDDEVFLLEIRDLKRYLAAARACSRVAEAKRLLATAVELACGHLDSRSQSFPALLGLLRDYPSRRQEAADALLGNPKRLCEFLQAFRQALGLAHPGDADVTHLVECVLESIPKVVKEPPSADDFASAWNTLASLVCKSGSCVLLSPTAVMDVKRITRSTELAATACALARPSALQNFGNVHDHDVTLTQLTLAAVVGQTFIDSVLEPDDGVAARLQRNAPVARGYWPSLDEPISLFSALKRCTGSTAEAEATRRQLADELATRLMQHFAPGGYPDFESVHSALSEFLGDAHPLLDYAPTWTVASEDALVHALALGDTQLVIEKLRDYSHVLANQIHRRQADSESAELPEISDPEIW